MDVATKTISLRLEAYERLRKARRYPDESFSEVVLRAEWPDTTLTGAELLERCRRTELCFTEDALSRIETLNAADRPPENKWGGT